MSLYSCSKCGASVSKSATSCPSCQVRLVGIRCTSCHFAGSESDFPNDRCPKCGARIYRSGGGGGSSGPNDSAAGFGCLLVLIGLIAWGVNSATRGPGKVKESTISLNTAKSNTPHVMQPGKPPAAKPGENPKTQVHHIDEYLAALDSPDKTKWRTALENLRQMGFEARPAWPKVVRVLAEMDPVLVTAAELTLATMGPLSRSDIASVMAAVDHPNGSVRRHAVETLGKMNDKGAIPTLLVAASDRDDKVSQSAIKALGGLSKDHPTALDALDRLLVDGNATRARLAAMELTMLPLNVRVLKSLASGMYSPQDAARNTILLYVESEAVQKDIPRFGSDAAELYGAIAARGSTNSRIVAIQNLGKMKDAASGGVAGLTTAMQDQNANIRIESLKALASIGPASAAATEKLAHVAARDPEKPVRLLAFGALKAIGPAAIDAVPTLIGLFEDPDNQIGVESLSTLGAIGKPAVPKLVEKLDDRKQIIRLGAVQALTAIGPNAADAIPALQNRLKKETNAIIRANIQSALKAIRTKS